MTHDHPGRPADGRHLLGPASSPAPAWSARLIANGGPGVPEYGTPDWLALDDNDPAKVAATVAAAEAWRVANDPATIADRLRLQLAAERHVAQAQAQAEEDTVWQAVAADVRARAGRPSYAQLSDLRGETERAARAREAEVAHTGYVSPPPQGGVPAPLPGHRDPVQDPRWPRVPVPVREALVR